MTNLILANNRWSPLQPAVNKFSDGLDEWQILTLDYIVGMFGPPSSAQAGSSNTTPSSVRSHVGGNIARASCGMDKVRWRFSAFRFDHIETISHRDRRYSSITSGPVSWAARLVRTIGPNELMTRGIQIFARYLRAIIGKLVELV